MSHRTIASRLRRVTASAVVPVAAVLAFAPAAGAFTGTTYPSTVLTPGSPTASAAANGTALATAISGLTPSGGFNVIQLCGCQYAPTTQLAIPANVQVEITGPPLLQIASNGTNQNLAPSISIAYSGANPLLNNDIITVASGDSVILKGFNITGAAPGFAAIRTNGGSTVMENMSLDNQQGNGITAAGGSLNVNNSFIGDNQALATGSGEGVTQLAGATVSMTSTTVANNNKYGITGNGYTLTNDLFSGNVVGSCQGTPGTVNAGNLDDDGLCGSAGGSSDPALTVQTPAFYNGGPTKTAPITGESAPGADNISTGCPVEDQRFFNSSSTSSCNPGSWQTGTISSEAQGATAPISCTVTSTTEIPNGGTGSSMQTVGVTDPTSYLGPDTILNATTNNGTISWPVVSGTLFDAVSPSYPQWPDQPTNGTYTVTAIKTAGDATAHDTAWSFTAMDWLGNTKACS